MNPEFSVGKLRKVGERLRAIPYDRSTYYNATVAPQEALDYLCMIGGIKPVYLLGRGFDDMAWGKAIAALSKDLALHVRIGSALDPPRADLSIPDWYRDWLDSNMRKTPVVYISRTRGVADRIGDLLQRGEISIEEEAELLHFPECCVREHHQTREAVDRAEYEMARREGQNDRETMERILKGEIPVAPASEAEHAVLNPDWVMCPFTSFFMCGTCREGGDTPARKISDRQMRFAKRVASGLYDSLASISQESPVYRSARPAANSE